MARQLSRRSIAILAIATICTIALFAHAPLLNGPYYWKWPWRRLPVMRTLLIGSALLPMFAALWLGSRFGKTLRVFALILLMFATVQMRLCAAASVDPHFGFDWLDQVIRNPDITSYYIDAAATSSVSGWLALYPAISHQLHLHTQSKPPGPVAWYALWIRLLGYGRRSTVGSAIALAALQSLAVPAVYWLVRQLTERKDAAFYAAAFLAFCPSITLMFPMLDPTYAVLTSAIVIAADRVLRTPTIINASLAGTILAASTFCTYSVLTLGLFLIAYGIVVLGPRKFAAVLPKIALGSGIGFAVFYGTLWLAFAFDPWATFVAAWQNQHALLAAHAADRPYPMTAVFDLTDFCLGIGWIGVVAVGSFFVQSSNSRLRALCILCVAQPVLIAITGLMQSETFRVWNFMLPLIAIPAGLAMERWSESERVCYFVGTAIVLMGVAANVNLFP